MFCLVVKEKKTYCPFSVCSILLFEMTKRIFFSSAAGPLFDNKNDYSFLRINKHTENNENRTIGTITY